MAFNPSLGPTGILAHEPARHVAAARSRTRASRDNFPETAFFFFLAGDVLRWEAGVTFFTSAGQMRDGEEGIELLTRHSACRGGLTARGATRVHIHSVSPPLAVSPCHPIKPPLKKPPVPPFYGCQMAGWPPRLWTCLCSLVKPADLSDIKTAIYEKAWKKNTHKHPAAKTVKCHLIS